MARIVMKFGGTSVGDIERMRRVGRHVKREVDAGNEVAVVVSAMAGETNRLVALCREAAPMHDAREYDAVVAAGEQISTGLLAIVLQEMGISARSWQGWQIPIQTSNMHGAARIEAIEGAEIVRRMGEGQIAVIAGFQGLADDNRVTTLGRGGSDTSAVAVAAALKADRCDIYTDVDGVYTTDPRIVDRARKIDRISYEEMFEMASLGAKVLQTRSVELAMVHRVRLQVLSSFIEPEALKPELLPGTLVCDEEEIVESHVVTGIAFSRDEAKITLRRVADRPGVAAAIFGRLADAGINVDMIVQNISEDGNETDVTFTCPRDRAEEAARALKPLQTEHGFASISVDPNVAKVSIVGMGMKSHAGVARKMFETLAERNINILVISTSEIKISVLINSEYTELAVRALHQAYGLEHH